MTETCSKCIPIRLRTAKSEPLTPIVWAHPDFETLGQFIVPSEKAGERFDAKLDILKRTRTLIGDTLVWEINIAPHDPTPKTLLGRLKQRWDGALPDRRAHPVQWFLIGVALGMVAIALGWFMWDGLVSLMSYPLASMVWVWVKLGVFLPLVALFCGRVFCGVGGAH